MLFPELEQLRQENRITQGFKYTKQSAANVISAIRQFTYFTTFFELEALPASVDTLTCFLQFMARSSGHAHLKHLLSSVKFLHQALGYIFPENDFQVDMTMQGLKRRLAKVPFQVLPLTPKVLRNMYPHINLASPEDRALWGAYLTSFFCLLRKSNAVPKDTLYDPRKILVRRNFRIDLRNNMVYLYIGFGKTNQFGNRDQIIPVPGNGDAALNLVHHLSAIFSHYEASPNEPAFSFAPGKFISYSKFSSRLKTLLRKAGYNPDLYSGHSFRRGGATFLYGCGGTALQVQSAGDWSSLCYTRYLYLSEGERLQAQQIIANGIMNTLGG